MSDEEILRRLQSLETVQRDQTAQLRRFGTQVVRTPKPYWPPALGTWLVMVVNGTATEPVDPTSDWDSFFGDVANYDYRRMSALPTRVGELHAIFQARDTTFSGWVDPDHKRFFTAFDNLGPQYDAKLILTFSLSGHVYVKHNGKGTDYTTGRNEITLPIVRGRNKVVIQAKSLTSSATGGVAIEFTGALQLEGVLFNPDQCEWRVGRPKGPFFSEITGDDDGGGGGGGGGGGDSIGTETGGGGGIGL
jgi:hypothetical protein